MKQLTLWVLAILATTVSFAQPNSKEIQLATDLIRRHAQQLNLSDADIRESKISSTYQTTRDGIRMIYLQQTFRGFPVHNQLQVMAFRNGQLLSNSGGRLRAIEQMENARTATAGISPADAIRSAMQQIKMDIPPVMVPQEVKNGRINFGTLDRTQYDVQVEQVWLPLNEKSFRLCWEVELAPLKSPDHWMIRVDAMTGQVLDKNNLTVFEQFGSPNHADHPSELTHSNLSARESASTGNSPLVVNSATYRVVPYPVESPNHTGGTPSLVTDPWAPAAGAASALKWHFDGTTYHDSTRGNNVWAQEDRDNNNTTFGKAALSTTAQPSLTLDFTPNFTQAPTVTANQNLAITNLFYWNNIMHDIMYLYGFDEPSGNFQNNNQGLGGTGNDYVIADAQDAGGTNNANFSTPVDGSRPRMQMYLFTSTTPNRDGDLDNGVITHEYGHGISNRLTGGPANSSCLSNTETGSEGWSDYVALMTTTNWATALTTDGTKSRPMGTYVLGQATTGAGIRLYPYSTNMAVNPWTYAMLATNTSGEVHNVGEIWCTALWEMTWELIAMDGINPNLYNPAGTGGNSAALKLVIEGMRLQPCNPGFIDSRNAILKADTIFFGGKYSCAIWKAFAKRGMGAFASQGSTNSYTDQVASFVEGGSMSLSLTQSVTQQQEGLQVTYTNKVTAGGCSNVNNFLLTDTLPSNVTYVSGGTYNAGNRVVSFAVNLAAGQSQNYSFTVQINNGSYFPSQTLLDEQVTGTAGTIPAAWTAASTTTSVWTTHNTRSKSAPNSFFTPNRTSVSDQTLALTNQIALDANPPELSFWHWINSESGWDGGVVEITTNNGTTWTDLGPRMTINGYNGSLGASGNPLTNRSAFTGNSSGFIRTAVDLSPYANQSVRFRFRFGSDETVATTGWNVDDILLFKQARVKIKSSLFSNTSVLVATADTFTIILQNSCVPGSISSQPAAVNICANANASFSVSAAGTAITYQWQVSTDGGTTYTNISGETGSTLNLVNVPASANGNRYRCVINGTCTTSLNSDAAILSVTANPTAPTVTNGSVCGSGTVNLSASTAVGNTIDWYTVATGGTAFVTNATTYTTPVLTNTTTYYVEARNTSLGCLSTNRTAVVATVNPLPTVINATGASVCGSGSASITATASAGAVIDWYATATGGSSLQSGSASFNTPVVSVTTTYYAEARNTATGCTSASRTAVAITVNALPTITNVSGASLCGSGNTSINAGASIGAAVDWYAVASGGTAVQLASNVYNTPVLTATTTYYVQARDVTTGCISAVRLPVTVTVLAKTSSTTNITVCNNQLPYEWNGNSYNSGGSYTLHFTNSVGCDSAATLNLSVLPAILNQTITGGGSYNSGGAGVPVGLASSQLNVLYQLILNGNTNVGTPITGTGTAIGFGNQTAPGVYTVLATYLGCEQLIPNSVTVTVLANQPPVAYPVTGGGTYCQGSSGVAIGLANSELGVNYQLYRSNGSIAVGSAVSGTGSAISFGFQTTTGDYSVVGTRISNGLTQSMLNSVLVRMAQLRAPSAPGAVTGPTDVCTFIGGAPVLYKINQASNATSYIWTAPAGATIIGSNTDTAVLVQYPIGFVSGTLSVQSVNACFGNAVSSIRNVSITRRVPGTPSSIVASNSNPCAILGSNNTITYTTRSVTYATGYTWTLGAGMMLVGSQGDTGVVVRFDAGFTTGVISVVATNACWTSNARSLTVTASKPAAPAVINGPTAVCDFVGTATTANYNIADVSGATGYEWTIPGNASIVSGQGTNSISVLYQNGFTSGSIMVASVSPCGNSSARSLSVAATKPGTPTVITGPTQVCPFINQATNAFYTIDPVANATSYQWTAPANATIVSGQGSLTVEISFAAGFTSGNLSVRAAANCGISSARSLALTRSVARPGAITASASPCPNTTVTYSIDPVPNATGYQWALPSNAIYVSGQGTTSYTVTFKSTFTTGQVAVKALNACSSSANTTLALDATICSQVQKGMIAAENKATLIYPNPAHQSFRLAYTATQSNENIRLSVIDRLGNTVKQESVRSVTAGRNQITVWIGNLPSGVYEVRLVRNGSVETSKLVVSE